MRIRIMYNEANGTFNITSNPSAYYAAQWSQIAIVEDMKIADAFVAWVSKTRDLSNQPDKPWEYVGQKPSLELIKLDWQTFESILPFIKL